VRGYEMGGCKRIRCERRGCERKGFEMGGCKRIEEGRRE